MYVGNNVLLFDDEVYCIFVIIQLALEGTENLL